VETKALHSEKLHNLCSSSGAVRVLVVKSGRLQWGTGNVYTEEQLQRKWKNNNIKVKNLL
jgi:hypothetical protein